MNWRNWMIFSFGFVVSDIPKCPPPQPTNEMTPGFKPFTTKCCALIMSSTFLVPIVSAI